MNSGVFIVVENNYLGSDDHQEKTTLEYNQNQGALTEEQEKRLLELKAKDEATTDNLIQACADISSAACQAERQKVSDEMSTYKNLTYLNPKEQQEGYKVMNDLLQATSPEGDVVRQIYNGYKNGYLGLGYSEDEAATLAGRVVGTQLILQGIGGKIALPALNKILSNSSAFASKVKSSSSAIVKENLPTIKGTQTGLRNPAQIDSMKNDMTSGAYDFKAPKNVIAGYVDSKGNYYVTEGHHRMAAAQELYKSTGNASYIKELLANGRWDVVTKPPVDAQSLPKRK